MEFHFKVELFLFATFLAYCEVCIKYTHLFGNVFESVLQESLGQCIGDLKGHGGIFFCLDHSLRLKKTPKIIMNKHCLQVKLTEISIFCRISMLQIFLQVILIPQSLHALENSILIKHGTYTMYPVVRKYQHS